MIAIPIAVSIIALAWAECEIRTLRARVTELERKSREV
jgi:hypothetical protein